MSLRGSGTSDCLGGWVKEGVALAALQPTFGGTIWGVPLLSKQWCQMLIEGGSFIAHTSCGWNDKGSEGGVFHLLYPLLVGPLLLEFVLPVNVYVQVYRSFIFTWSHSIFCAGVGLVPRLVLDLPVGSWKPINIASFWGGVRIMYAIRPPWRKLTPAPALTSTLRGCSSHLTQEYRQHIANTTISEATMSQ